MTPCYIGLGSNLDNPPQQIQKALTALRQLPQSHFTACSRFYCSPPFSAPYDQPDYLNAVVLIKTALSPLELLKSLQTIENQQKRVRTQHWGPRTLDLDLLLYGNQKLQTPELILPHPGLMMRPFVLYPLHDINPALILPGGLPLKQILEKITADNLVLYSQTSP